MESVFRKEYVEPVVEVHQLNWSDILTISDETPIGGGGTGTLAVPGDKGTLADPGKTIYY